MNELYQKKGTDFKHYKIESEGVFLEQKYQGNFYSKLIKFHEFNNEISVQGVKPNSWAIAFLLSFSFNLFLVALFVFEELDLSDSLESAIALSLVLPIVIISIPLLKKEKVKVIHGYKLTLPFYYDRKTEETDRFIEAIFTAKKEHFREKFMQVESHKSYAEMMDNFKWLLDLEYISKQEFDELVESIENRRLFNGE